MFLALENRELTTHQILTCSINFFVFGFYVALQWGTISVCIDILLLIPRAIGFSPLQWMLLKVTGDFLKHLGCHGADEEEKAHDAH